MITIGIYDHLAAPDHDMEHHVVPARMPRQHRFELFGEPCIAAR